jgi:FMN phosphatase YigB (HAD superfamily)
MLKAVIMDVDGTLYRQMPVRLRMAWRLTIFALSRPFLGQKTIQVLRAYRRAQENLRGSDAGSQSALRQVETAAQMTGYAPEFVKHCVSRWMEDEPLRFVAESRYPGVIEFFDWASRRNLRLAVISDYDPREKLRALALDSYLSAVVWAQQDEIGVFKPNPRALRVAAARLGIEPAEAIYVGDRADVDVSAALAAGIPPVLLGRNVSDSRPGVSSVNDWDGLRIFVEQSMCVAERMGIGV